MGFALTTAAIVALLCSVPVGLVISSQSVRLEKLNALLEHDSCHDYLTELPNRRAFFADIDRLLESGEETALLIADADKFKEVNDRFGHDTGDEVLKELARCLAAKVPEDALLARLGGEEFGVLLPGTNLRQARMIAETLREEVQKLSFYTPDGLPCPLTVSIGIDMLLAEKSQFPLRGADSALYDAKKSGRNRVALCDIAPPPRASKEKAA